MTKKDALYQLMGESEKYISMVGAELVVAWQATIESDSVTPNQHLDRALSALRTLTLLVEHAREVK